MRWAGRGTVSDLEAGLQSAIFAFGEISDEGALSYFFCARGSEAARAREVLQAADAGAAARVVEKALGLVDFTQDVPRRRVMLEGLDDDRRAALAALQWEMDALREPTLAALAKYARANRASLR